MNLFLTTCRHALSSSLLLLLAACGGQKYSGSQDTQAMYNSIHAHGEQTAKQLGMRFLFVGNVTDNQDVHYCLSFTSTKAMSINQARPMGVSIVKDFLDKLEQDETVLTYLNTKPSYLREDELPSLDSIGFRINFLDKEMKPIEQPYLAQILFFDGRFHYYKADAKTQGVRLVFEESYESALRNLKGRG
jgi:hypothetical protein